MYAINVVIDDVIDALGDFLEPFVGESVEIIRGQVNRTPPPVAAYVELTELLSVDLAIPYQECADDPENPEDSVTWLTGRTRIDVQVDFYGPSSGDWCRAVQNAFRTGYGFDSFPDTMKPLYTTDGFQHPWNTAEQQSVTRWTLTASIQYNPKADAPQQFADTLTPSVNVPADQPAS